MTNPARAGLFGWLFRYALFTVVVLVLGLGLIGRAAYRSFASELPQLDEVGAYEDLAPGVTRIYAADGSLLAELAREHRAYTRLDDIPEPLIAAFLSAEDRRFFAHAGLDFRGLARATQANIRSGTIVQGGSTITQQVAKSFLANQERTLARKVREAILALRMESRLGKAKILEIYLNKIFLGHGAYGVRAAASRYFDKDLDELSLAECALIAGLAQAPSRWSPVANPELAQRRRDIVLRDMVEAGYIDEAEAEVAAREAIKLAHIRDPFRWRAPFFAEGVRRRVSTQLGDEAVLADGLVIETTALLPRQRAADAAVDAAVRRLDRRHGWRGPEAHLRREDARETLRSRMRESYGRDPFAGQRWVLGLVEEMHRNYAEVDLGHAKVRLRLRDGLWAAPYDRRTGVNDLEINDLRDALQVGDVVWVEPELNREDQRQYDEQSGRMLVALGQTPTLEASLLSFDHRSGYVEAVAAGADYDRSQFDRTTQACRSPGSVFKAIYYTLALDRGWQMDDVLEAKPWEPEPGEVWNPRNIDKTIDGKVLLRTALIKSLNTPSIRLFLAVGIDEVVSFARELGFTTELIADKGLSLGASCVHIDELTRAFGVFARGGSMRDPVYVRRIIDKRGSLRVDRRHPEDGAVDLAGRIDRMAAMAQTPARQIIDPGTAFLIGRLLREVVTAGTSTRANTIGAPAAGKSGTASGRYRRDGRLDDLTTDTWFVGYTSRHVTSAWLGFDDRNERSLGDEDASFTTAIPMWARYMKQVVAGREHQPLPLHQPEGIGRKVVDATHGGPPLPGLPTATIYYRHDLRREPPIDAEAASPTPP